MIGFIRRWLGLYDGKPVAPVPDTHRELLVKIRREIRKNGALLAEIDRIKAKKDVDDEVIGTVTPLAIVSGTTLPIKPRWW